MTLDGICVLAFLVSRAIRHGYYTQPIEIYYIVHDGKDSPKKKNMNYIEVGLLFLVLRIEYYLYISIVTFSTIL